MLFTKKIAFVIVLLFAVFNSINAYSGNIVNNTSKEQTALININLLNPNSILKGKNISITTGKEILSSNFCVTNYIPIKQNTNYTITRSNCLTFYDKKKNFLSGLYINGVLPCSFTSPTKSAFLRLSFPLGFDILKNKLVETEVLKENKKINDSDNKEEIHFSNLLEYDEKNHIANIYGKYGKEKDIRFKFCNQTINQIFALYQFNIFENKNPIPQKYTGKEDITTKTDWIGPYMIRAINDGDDGCEIFTGGVHSSENNAKTGMPTAKTVLFDIFADGKRITANGDYYADKIDIYVKNKIMAYNTISTQRYVLDETVHYTVHDSQIDVQLEFKTLEDLACRIYYGQQAPVSYYTNVYYPLTALSSEAGISNPSDSGQKSDYMVDTIILSKAGTKETLEMLMDNTTGLGKREYVNDNKSLAFVAIPSKAYMRLIGDTEKILPANQIYCWKGSYIFSNSQ